MLPLLSVLIPFLKLDQFKCRQLTPAEIQLCEPIFGHLIDYSQVRIMNHLFVPWQSAWVVMAPCGDIHAHNRHYKADYSQASLGYQALFIHEMTHIYQYQQGINVLLRGALLQTAFFLTGKKYNPYAYRLKSNKTFNCYNIEQQGDIARDIFLKKIPNIILQPHLANLDQ
jgi:hypothetical protein